LDPQRAAISDEQWQAALQLWNFHRLRQPLQRCDAAIGLGSHDIGVARHAAELYHAGWFPLIVFSGAVNPIRPEQFPDGEAAHFRDEARPAPDRWRMTRVRENDGMRVFISSVRRELEEERDALPGLISALGHTPVRFEDFTAQPMPSREACLEGVASASVYLLILGPRYGDPMPDTGQSPTHDEWTAAQAAGMPRLVYRKQGVTFEPAQEEFIRSIGAYDTGVFYESFASTAELQTKVARKLRELESAGDPLAFTQLPLPMTPTWCSDFEERNGAAPDLPTAVEVHVLPAVSTNRPARVVAELEQLVPARLRASGVIDAADPLTQSRRGGAVLVTVPVRRTGWNEVREPHLLGVRTAADGQSSAWASLPGDGMGAILDPDALPGQIAGLLRLVGSLGVVESDQVAIGVGVSTSGMLSTGRVTGQPRHQAMSLMLRNHPVHVPPDELVTLTALGPGAAEVGRALSRSLIAAVSTRR
jgi:hypothetical protein